MNIGLFSDTSTPCINWVTFFINILKRKLKKNGLNDKYNTKEINTHSLIRYEEFSSTVFEDKIEKLCLKMLDS